MKIRQVIGWILGAAHALIAAHAVRIILSGAEADWPMIWLAFMGLDFPYSVLFVPLSLAAGLFGPTLPGIAPPLGDVGNFILPALFFGVGGTLWYYYLPQMVMRATEDKRFRNRFLLTLAAAFLILILTLVLKKSFR